MAIATTTITMTKTEKENNKSRNWEGEIESDGIKRPKVTYEPATTVDLADAESDLFPSSSYQKRKRDVEDVEELEIDISAPEPPSKKALRRAKHGKTSSRFKSSKNTFGTSDLESVEEEEDIEKILKRSDPGIWIGNLPFTTTKADLKKFLIDHSDISEQQIQRVHLPAPNESAATTGPPSRQRVKPQNKGFAYIDFTTTIAQEQALSLSETLLTGRRVLIKNAKSFEGRPEKSKDSIDATAMNKGERSSSKRIFVGNLGFDITKDDLQEHFARCGEIEDIHIATFEDTGKCKGYAWVQFDRVEAGEAAVKGWIRIPEAQDEDSEDGEEDGSGEQDDIRGTRKMKGPKMRKWWVNRIKGRPLRMEFAEDKAIRYKKRFGKDGTARKGSNADIAEDRESSEGGAEERDIITDAVSGEGEQVVLNVTAGKRSVNIGDKGTRTVTARRIKPGGPIVQRLTGAIIESKGKKTTF